MRNFSHTVLFCSHNSIMNNGNKYAQRELRLEIDIVLLISLIKEDASI